MRIPEHWLSRVYQNLSTLKTPLRTTNDETVKILQPGAVNDGDGPDIKNALLEIAGIRQRGDVEFHCFPEDWFRHGHEHDLRYQQVILHILWHAPKGIPERLARRFPHLIIKNHLRDDETVWRAKMAALENEDIPDNVAEIPAEATIDRNVLATYAEQRFQQKVARYREWAGQFSLEDILFIALAETLGYSRNKFPFRQLLWQSPPSHLENILSPRHRTPQKVWILLGLQGGLLQSQHFAEDAFGLSADWYNALRKQGQYPLMQLRDWHFARLRPANNPYLRLGALAQLFTRYSPVSLFSRLLEIAMTRGSYEATRRQWLDILMLQTEPGLAQLIKSITGFRQVPVHLLGENRANQFCLNVLLPLFYFWASRTANNGFATYLESLYETFPAAGDNRMIRQGLAKISDPALRKSLRRQAFYQQGLIEYLTQHPQQHSLPVAGE